jgi:hypothetical protein
VKLSIREINMDYDTFIADHLHGALSGTSYVTISTGKFTLMLEDMYRQAYDLGRYKGRQEGLIMKDYSQDIAE